MSLSQFKTIKLRLGDFTACAFVSAKEHAAALVSRSVKGATVFTVQTPEQRKHALAILYYMEASPAFFGDDAELTERSAIRRTAAKWREQLGISPHAEIPTPYTANRINIDKPTAEEAAREANGAQP